MIPVHVPERRDLACVILSQPDDLFGLGVNQPGDLGGVGRRLGRKLPTEIINVGRESLHDAIAHGRDGGRVIDDAWGILRHGLGWECGSVHVPDTPPIASVFPETCKLPLFETVPDGLNALPEDVSSFRSGDGDTRSLLKHALTTNGPWLGLRQGDGCTRHG